MSSPLEREIKAFAKHQAEWIKNHPNKFVLVKGDALIGAYDTAEVAVNEGIKRFGVESFLVRNVNQGPDEELKIPALMFGLLTSADLPLPA